MIDQTAIIDPGAIIHPTTQIGAYAVIGKHVMLGENNIIDSHVVIQGPTEIGNHNHIYPFASIGGDPQDISYVAGQKSTLKIGDNNQIREYCTLNRGTEKDQGVTQLGSNNLLMAYVHIAHDCQVANNIILANNTSLAGHVILDDWVYLGGFTLVKQRCHVGCYVFSGMGSQITKDVPPFLSVSAHPTRIRGINTIGMRRHGFDDATILAIKKAYQAVYQRNNQTVKEAVNDFHCAGASQHQVVHDFLNFIRHAAAILQ